MDGSHHKGESQYLQQAENESLLLFLWHQQTVLSGMIIIPTVGGCKIQVDVNCLQLQEKQSVGEVKCVDIFLILMLLLVQINTHHSNTDNAIISLIL